MTTYAWAKGFPAKIKAEVFGAEKDRIAAEKGLEVIQPEDILEAARNKKSPINPAFEWNDAVAAEKHRVEQARKMLTNLEIVRVEIESGPAISSRAMFVVSRDGDRRGYMNADAIMGDRELKAQVIARARRELESYLNKYKSVLAMGRFIPRLQLVTDEMLDEIAQLESDANRRSAPRTRTHQAPLQPTE